MKITKKDLQKSVEGLSSKIESITGENPKYKLVSGDTRLGKVYSIGKEYNQSLQTICHYMSAKELDAYIWGMYKAFDIVKA